MDSEPKNLARIQEDYFRNHLRRTLKAYQEHYQDRLMAVSVFGSVHRNEALPGISDLDLIVILRDEYNPMDRAWRRDTEARLKKEYPEFPNLPRGDSLDGFFSGFHDGAEEWRWRRSLAWGYFMRYDSTLLWGVDPTTDWHIPPPDLVWVKLRFPDLRRFLRRVAGLEAQTEEDAVLPEDPSIRLRKLARHGVLSGTYLLIALGAFQSFKASEVIPALTARYPKWTEFLENTGRLACSLPEASEEDAALYLASLVSWLDEIQDTQNQNG